MTLCQEMNEDPIAGTHRMWFIVEQEWKWQNGTKLICTETN